MAKKKRRAFPGEATPPKRRTNAADVETIDADEPGFGVFGWFRNPGVRETIESIVIAILLAFMFKTYEAEAFVIPTGSMAPSLQGQHKDHDCEECGYVYLTGASQEGKGYNGRVDSTICPICNYRNLMSNKDNAHVSNSGDRILVNKFIYDFNEPERFDVIVFKYPNNAKQNYIKRLIGLPGDNILIENGDIYLMHEDPSAEGGWRKEIARKPSAKVRQVLIDVDDTKYVSKKLREIDWPTRWAQWDDGKEWTAQTVGGEDLWQFNAGEDKAWLRYRHLKRFQHERTSNFPPTVDYNILPATPDSMANMPAGRLITDSMSYNNGRYRQSGKGIERYLPPTGDAFHWVGDLGVEAWFELESATGEVAFDLVEGGVHFECRIDVAAGTATLHCSDPQIGFVNDDDQKVATPTANVSLSAGSNRILMVNADDQIHLWVNDSLVNFDAAKFNRIGAPIPTYSPEDPGDAEPVGVAAKNVGMTVTRLKVVRDVYYSSVSHADGGSTFNDNESKLDRSNIIRIMEAPRTWDRPAAQEYFLTKRNATKPMFRLKFGKELGASRDKDQFFPMGDNSTQSLDARVWPGPEQFVERDLLIGRAIFVYWPHTLNEPVKHFPNFGKMKFIR